jgi:hypothetical protein
MTASVKFGLLFAGGLTLGMVVPWGLERAKSPRPDDAVQQPRERTLTVRCVVEDQRGWQLADPRTGRRLPVPDDFLPAGVTASQVEVVVEPTPVKHTPTGDVIVTLRVRPVGDQQAPKEENPPHGGESSSRTMPRAF